ncbi:MAG: LytR/AlgR family response regulator transcription factor [Lachnospirales bacterium]
MLKIAFCDDFEDDRASVKNSLIEIENKWEVKFATASFSSGEALLEDIKKNNYDIILLDIIMSGIDGIETARKIRDINKSSLIIFISSYEARLKELFGFRTIAFLDKPIVTCDLEKALIEACDIIDAEKEIQFKYNKNGVEYFISTRDIMYFESVRNKIFVHTKNITEDFNGTLKGVWEQLENNKDFVFTSRSYIFNFNYINLKSDKVELKGSGENFNIGRNLKSEVRERYLKYIRER